MTQHEFMQVDTIKFGRRFETISNDAMKVLQQTRWKIEGEDVDASS
jgi:hypothetical protein